MNIKTCKLDGTNEQRPQDVNFAEPGAGQNYIDYAQTLSADGQLVLLGEGLDMVKGSVVHVVAVSGVVAFQDLVE